MQGTTQPAARTAATPARSVVVQQPAQSAQTAIPADALHDPLQVAVGRSRVIIEAPAPWVDGGRFAAKRSAGETVRVEADVFTDGHDKVAAILRHRRPGREAWHEVEMQPLVNDRWFAEFDVHTVGFHEYEVHAWVDRFATWRYDFQKRVTAGQDVGVDLLVGAGIVEETADALSAGQAEAAKALLGFAALLRSDTRAEAVETALGASLQTQMRRSGLRLFATTFPSTPARIWVDRERARFSSWYEFFPRSASNDPNRHGTLRDAAAKLDYVASMGFNVVYLPPIHPIGLAFRKGPNNSPTAGPNDLGSPWAIGGPEGGHDAIHPDLGTFEDFDALIASAKAVGIEIAMDLAFQCSPDHPYVKSHPEWFRHRPDGTIQYAENPPKKYQDIYPFDFECEDHEALWAELLRVTLFWNGKGVKIFRVDNPHTKPFPFWEWLIARVKEHDPDVLFLAEAFTRPKVMYRLAKLGFTQSYTYFAWRNEPWALKQYLTELTAEPVVDFFRPNVWPNTPDILPEYLQSDARSAYVVRAILAATISANYGVYGPAFELRDNRPVAPGKEEYLDSEKYQRRQWDTGRIDSLADLLGRLNKIRKQNPALQFDRGIKFHNSDNPNVICYSKKQGDNAILVVVNTDPYRLHWANIDLDLAAMGVPLDQPFQAHDLLTDARYRWQGNWQVVGLDPGSLPAHVFAIRKRARTENDFEYFV